MTTNPVRQPQGISAGGQFAPARHGEADVSLEAGPKNPEWHRVAAALTADGRSLSEAKCGVSAVLALQTAKTLHDSGRRHLDAGHETSAAMLAIAASTLNGLPAALEAAGGDQAVAQDAVRAARRRLKSAGSLLDMTHPSGRQPVFRGTDEVLADIEDFLAVN